MAPPFKDYSKIGKKISVIFNLFTIQDKDIIDGLEIMKVDRGNTTTSYVIRQLIREEIARKLYDLDILEKEITCNE
jgi:hypothetical protein